MEGRSEGKFCNACAKTVIDFTRMSDEEVKNFLLKKQDDKVCGRFSSVQLNPITINLPKNILTLRMPYWKKFLAASLIVFSSTLFSCNTNYDATIGMVAPVVTKKIANTIPASDSMLPLVGKIKLTDTISTKKNCSATIGMILPPDVMGEVSYTKLPIDSAKQTPHALMGDIMFLPLKDSENKMPKITHLKTDSCENTIFL